MKTPPRDNLRLFRGISVNSQNADAVVAGIRHDGLSGSEGVWEMRIHDIRSELPRLRAKSDLTIADTRNGEPLAAVCACGELDGARYYALRHNRNAEDDYPLVIEFEVPLSYVFIDGKDFLYPLFQRGRSAARREAIAEAFGSTALEYADHAWSSDDGSFRIAICDLACQDVQVALDHYANKNVLEGRYSTVFRSAFIIRCPVQSDQVVRVFSPEGPCAIRPDFVLADLYWSA